MNELEQEKESATCCFCVPLDLGTWILTFYMMAYGAAAHIEFIVFLVNFSYYKTDIIIYNLISSFVGMVTLYCALRRCCLHNVPGMVAQKIGLILMAVNVVMEYIVFYLLLKNHNKDVAGLFNREFNVLNNHLDQVNDYWKNKADVAKPDFEGKLIMVGVVALIYFIFVIFWICNTAQWIELEETRLESENDEGDQNDPEKKPFMPEGNRMA